MPVAAVLVGAGFKAGSSSRSSAQRFGGAITRPRDATRTPRGALHTGRARSRRIAGGHNDSADAATPRLDHGGKPSKHDGMSAFGEQVLAEMSRVGIMVVAAHISKAPPRCHATVARARQRIAFGARAVKDVRRNMDDETLECP